MMYCIGLRDAVFIELHDTVFNHSCLRGERLHLEFRARMQSSHLKYNVRKCINVICTASNIEGLA